MRAEFFLAAGKGGQLYSMYITANYRLRELKAFSVSLSGTASVSVLWYCFLSLWIAYSIPHFCS